MNIGPSALTTVLAVWGAILSSITFGWNLFRDLRDRTKVEIDGTVGQFVRDDNGKLYFATMGFIGRNVDSFDPSVPTQFKLTLTNVGRRRVRIDGWAGMRGRNLSKGNHYRHLSRGLPRVLEEGESHEEFTEDTLKVLSVEVTRIVAWDSTGKLWRLPRRKLHKLKREAKELESKGLLKPVL